MAQQHLRWHEEQKKKAERAGHRIIFCNPNFSGGMSSLVSVMELLAEGEIQDTVVHCNGGQHRGPQVGAAVCLARGEAEDWQTADACLH